MCAHSHHPSPMLALGATQLCLHRQVTLQALLMLWPARLVCRAVRARACGKLQRTDLHITHLCRALATLPAPKLSLQEWRRRQKVVVVTGPTAVGKTAVSLALAELLDGEVISADSVQVYKGLDIGSDKVQCSVWLLARAVAGHRVVLVPSPARKQVIASFHWECRRCLWESGAASPTT